MSRIDFFLISLQNTIQELEWHFNHVFWILWPMYSRQEHFGTSCQNQLLPLGFGFLLPKNWQKCLWLLCRRIKNRVAYFFQLGTEVQIGQITFSAITRSKIILQCAFWAYICSFVTLDISYFMIYRQKVIPSYKNLRFC